MPTLKIQVDNYNDCGFRLVTDITVYSADRDEYGLALFVASGSIGGAVTNDSNLTDFSNPGSDVTPGEWVVTTENLKRYEYTMFMVPVFDAADTYAAHNMCYYAGNFYETAAGCGPSAFDPTDWTLMTVGDITVFTTALAAPSSNITSHTVVENIECVPFSMARTACHTYVLTADGTFFDEVSTHVYLYDVTGNEISDTEYTAGGSTITTHSISTGQDGVYRAKVVRSDGAWEWPIYDFCTLESCATGLLRKILCNCDDPCADSTCDDTGLLSYRDEINRMIALYYPLMDMVRADAMMNAGAYKIDQTRESFMTTISDIIARLRVVVNRCGVCDDDEGIEQEGCDC